MILKLNSNWQARTLNSNWQAGVYPLQHQPVQLERHKGINGGVLHVDLGQRSVVPPVVRLLGEFRLHVCVPGINHVRSHDTHANLFTELVQGLEVHIEILWYLDLRPGTRKYQLVRRDVYASICNTFEA